MTDPTTTEPPHGVALFVTCMVDALYPQVGLAAVRLLERHGVRVVFPERQTCCGQPAFNGGHRQEAHTMARHFLEVFGPLVEQGEVNCVVAPSGSCVAMVRHFYRILFEREGSEADRVRAARIAKVTYELCEYLVEVLGVRAIEARFEATAAYHPSCHLLRELGVDQQPRQLLRGVEGLSLVEPDGETACCGFGGLFAVKNPEISGAMGHRKARNLVNSGAEYVVMTDVSCLTHINGIFAREGLSCRGLHIAEVLAGDVPVLRSSEPGDTSDHDVGKP